MQPLLKRPETHQAESVTERYTVAQGTHDLIDVSRWLGVCSHSRGWS